MKLTENEKRVLLAIKYNYYQPDNGEGIDFNGSIWSDSINDSNRPSGINGKELSGVVGSLAKKGLVDTSDDGKDSTVWITKNGMEYLNDNPKVKENKMKGTKIERLATINSQYANGYLNVHTKDARTMRIHVNEILEMAKHFDFELDFARNYYHLKNPAIINKEEKND